MNKLELESILQELRETQEEVEHEQECKGVVEIEEVEEEIPLEWEYEEII